MGEAVTEIEHSEYGDPRTDPIGTVRVHPADDPTKVNVRRRIAVEDFDNAGPYVGARWERLTSSRFEGTGSLVEGCDPVHSDDVKTWPIQPWTSLVAVLHYEGNVTKARQDRIAATRTRWEVVINELLAEAFPTPAQQAHLRTNSVVARLAARIAGEHETLVDERDRAVLHDVQPYPTADAYRKVCRTLSKLQDGIDEHLTGLLGDEYMADAVRGKGVKSRVKVVRDLCEEAREKGVMDDLLQAHNWSRGSEGLTDLFSALVAEQARATPADQGEPDFDVVRLRLPKGIRLSDLQRRLRTAGIRIAIDLERGVDA